jgi:conserved oligomeric Golgi complex subunit 3
MRRVVEREVPVLRGRLELWIQDTRTRETLVRAVGEGVVQGYEEFLGQIEARRGDKGKSKGMAKAKGKEREDQVWDVETFVEWTEIVFGVTDNDEDDETGGQSRSLSRDGSI